MSEKGKHFLVANGGGKNWKTYEEAEKEAKRYTSQNQQTYFVYEAISAVTAPTPEAEVTKLT